MKKKKKKLTYDYVLQEIKIANAILDVIDENSGGNPAIKAKAKRDYFLQEIAPLIQVLK